MKKILTVSLVAMMAVSAARADIASTDYVTGKTGDIAGLTTSNKTNLTAAVNEVAGIAGAAATKTALQELTTTVGANKTAIETTVGTLSTKVDDIDAAYKAADETLTGKFGDLGNQTVKAYVDAKTENIASNDTVSGLSDRVTTAEGKVSTLEGKMTTAEGEIETLTGAATVEGSVANAKKAGTDAAAALNEYKTTVSNTYATQTALTQGLGTKQDTITDLADIRSGAEAGATALQQADITSGSANGTISVDGSDVSVKGLGTAAYANTDAFDAAGAAATAKSEAIADAASKYQAKALASGVDGDVAANPGNYYPSVQLTQELISGAQSDMTGLIGDMEDLTTTQKGSVVGAINEVKSTADSALSKANANESAINGLGALAKKNTIATTDIDAKAVTLEKLADGVQTSLGKANSAVQSVTTGTGNGNITVDGTQVAVSGLKSAAFAETTAFDASGAAAAAQTAAIAAAKTETQSQISALGLTAVSKVAVPTDCENGQATCALVYDSTNKTLKWEAIMK